MRYPNQVNLEISHDIYSKGWGYEKWIVNHDLYCGKLLFFIKGKRCSFHYHKIKTETFYLQSGLIKILHSTDDNIDKANEIILKPGFSFHVSVGLRHQVIALENSELFEFSTQHFETDSYRIIKGD